MLQEFMWKQLKEVLQDANALGGQSLNKTRSVWFKPVDLF